MAKMRRWWAPVLESEIWPENGIQLDGFPGVNALPNIHFCQQVSGASLHALLYLYPFFLVVRLIAAMFALLRTAQMKNIQTFWRRCYDVEISCEAAHSHFDAALHHTS